MPPEGSLYKIKVKGRLSADWSEWFDNLQVTHEPNGDTVLFGPVADQAELFGLLLRIRDLGLPLEFVVRITRRQDAGREKGIIQEGIQLTCSGYETIGSGIQKNK